MNDLTILQVRNDTIAWLKTLICKDCVKKIEEKVDDFCNFLDNDVVKKLAKLVEEGY